MNVEDQVVQGEVAEHDACQRDYLSGHDELCPMCEYNLRGLTGTMCPATRRPGRSNTAWGEQRQRAVGVVS